MITTKHPARWKYGMLFAFIVTPIGSYQVPVSANIGDTGIAAQQEFDTAPEFEDGAVPAITATRTTTTPDKTIVERDYADGSHDATIVYNPTVDPCGPRVLESDIEAWVEDQSLTSPPQPVGSGETIVCNDVSASIAADDPNAGLASGGSGVYVPDYRCDANSFDGNDIHVKACVNYDVKQRRNGRTTWSSRSTSSAWSSDDALFNPDRLYRLSVYSKHDNADVIEWAPSGTTFPDSGCTTETKTVTATINGSGISESKDVRRCADKFGVWAAGMHSSGARWETAKWVGKDIARSANFVNLATTTQAADRFIMRAYVRWK